MNKQEIYYFLDEMANSEKPWSVKYKDITISKVENMIKIIFPDLVLVAVLSQHNHDQQPNP